MSLLAKCYAALLLPVSVLAEEQTKEEEVKTEQAPEAIEPINMQMYAGAAMGLVAVLVVYKLLTKKPADVNVNLSDLIDERP